MPESNPRQIPFPSTQYARCGFHEADRNPLNQKESLSKAARQVSRSPRRKFYERNSMKALPAA